MMKNESHKVKGTNDDDYNSDETCNFHRRKATTMWSTFVYHRNITVPTTDLHRPKITLRYCDCTTG